jgi:NAD(P)-dependent dehydrogenase (short-subunit alcohol dehydrogenase family)
LFAFIEANHGGLNVLFNTIGTRGPKGVEVDEAAYDNTFDLNVKTHYYSVVGALPLLRARAPKASVVLMSSGAGLRYSGRSPLYSITKAAVIMMARTLARDLGPSGIRVNALCPGAVDTPFAGGEPDPQKRAAGLAAHAQQVPLRRVASARDVGQIVAFLASDAGAYLTGLAVPIDGGSLA